MIKMIGLAEQCVCVCVCVCDLEWRVGSWGNESEGGVKQSELV